MNRIREEKGQAIFLAAGLLLLFLVIAAVVMDLGWWLHDKRDAQNDVDASVLAGAQDLPGLDDPDNSSAAESAAEAWAADNGAGDDLITPCEFDHKPEGTDGPLNWIRCTVEREPGSLEEGLLDIGIITISASAAAARMRAVESCVVPWGVLGDENDPPAGGGTWGIQPETLYFFHSSAPSTPGNFGALRLYGQGTPGYEDAIKNACGTDPHHGCAYGEPLEPGETLSCRSEPGGMGINTCDPLADRYGGDCRGNAGSAGDCDAATYDDAVGKAKTGGCIDRAVPIPIIDAWPPAGTSTDLQILGIATFYIAGWDRKSPWGDQDVDGDGVADDAMVWGYFLPNGTILEAWRIKWGYTDDPFAPIRILLVE
jgi:hypothetical protein